MGILHGAEVAHELRGRLGNEGTLKAELLGIGHAVVALVGRSEARELIGMSHPIELASIHDHTAQVGSMTIHVLGG